MSSDNKTYRTITCSDCNKENQILAWDLAMHECMASNCLNVMCNDCLDKKEDFQTAFCKPCGLRYQEIRKKTIVPLKQNQDQTFTINIPSGIDQSKSFIEIPITLPKGWQLCESPIVLIEKDNAYEPSN